MFLLLPAVVQAMFLSRSSTLSADKAGMAGLSEVISLLSTNLANLEKSMGDDKVNWGNYQKLSNEQEADKTSYLQAMKSSVLAAEGQKSAAETQVQTLTTALTQLGTDLAEARASIVEITNMRNEEHSAHQGEVSDLTGTIESVNSAIRILESQYTAAGLAQVKQTLSKAVGVAEIEKLLTNDQVRTITNMVQQPDYLSSEHQSKDFSGAPTQEGGATVVATLKAIRTTLMENKQSSIEKDNEARRQFEETKTAKEGDASRMVTEQTEKTNSKGSAEATIGSATATITQGNADIGTAENAISLITADRNHFSTLYDERVASMNSEMAATQAAVDALQGITVGNSALQISKRVRAGLVQADSRLTSLRSLAAKLDKIGSKDHSAALVQASIAVGRLASAMQMREKVRQPATFYSADAMNPVKNLLKQLITRLEEELNAESSHKDWCDTEKTNSAAEKLKRENLIVALNAEIPQLKTEIATLESEEAFAAAELQKNYDETEEAKGVRAAAKAAYDTSKADHDEVITALGSALSSMTSAFLQTKTKKAFIQTSKQSPFSEIGDTGLGSAVDMLTDLEGKYTTARTGLVSEEEAAVAAHKQYLDLSEQFKTETLQTKQSISTEKRLKSERLGDAESELTAAGTELQQVTTYLEDLKPSCDDIRVSFEERKRRREAEIQALKEALQVLDEMAQGR
jgi:chromosome segregation ATPase